jgi:hypothetical protein
VSHDHAQPVSPEELAAFALGELSSQDAQRVRHAVQAQPGLQAKLTRIQSAAALLQTGTLADPPASTVQRALRLMGAAPAQAASWFDRVSDVVASLVFDSKATPTLAGFRGTGSIATRHMTFDSSAGEVDLEIRAPGPGAVAFQITGQIAASGADRATRVGFIEIGSTTSGETSVDDRGRFQFEVEAGVWDLRLAVGEETLALPRLIIG